MKKHPLQMTAAQRAKRLPAIARLMAEIERRLRSGIADPDQPNVFPALESEWALLDTERRQIEALK